MRIQDQNIFFVREFCRLFSNNNDCEKLNYKVFYCLWMGRKKLYDDVDFWWQLEDTLNAAKAFCNKYTFSDVNYIDKWIYKLGKYS